MLWSIPGTMASADAVGDAEAAASVRVAQTLNPCSPGGGTKNPCNPCGGKANPCNPCGGAKIDPARFQQPANFTYGGDREALLAEGEFLWNDRTLGNSGLACSTCHYNRYGQMEPTFAEPYPHRVAMPHQRAGVDRVTAAEMVNFCMIVPMNDEPLAWNSQQLAALATYVESIQGDYKAPASNPCNPCASKNACNPCGGESNPCSP
jgi:hypothetical protein